MERIRDEEELAVTPLPKDYFDLIGGTSTGGIIAIMLGRLEMSVEAAIEAYKELGKKAFTPKRMFSAPASPKGYYSATKLEEAAEHVVRAQCHEETCTHSHGTHSCTHEDELFREKNSCKTAVLAITKANVDSRPTLFTTYGNSASLANCTIWQVVRATSAATTFFKSIKCGRDEIEFIDAGFGYNNPCEILLEEAKTVFPDATEVRVLSIGTGLGDVVEIKDSRISILNALKTRYRHITRNYLKDQEREILRCAKALSKLSILPVPETGAPGHARGDTINSVQFTELAAQVPTQLESGAMTERTCVIFDVPRNTNKNYVERQSLVRQLDDILHPTLPGSHDARAALIGLVGSGKTELATKFAQKHRDCYSQVFWISATDSAQVISGFVRISTLLRLDDTTGSDGLTSKATSSKQMVELAQRWLVSNGGWLLVIDNVDEESVLEQVTGSILTTGMRGTILITARNESLKVGWSTVEVSNMTQEEALALLNSITGATYSSTVADALLQDLGYFALAIDQAATFMSVTGYNIMDYHALFREERSCLLEKYPSTQYNVGGKQSVMTTWEISYQKIEQQHSEAAKLLLMFSLMSHEDIPDKILQSCLETETCFVDWQEYKILLGRDCGIPNSLRGALTQRLSHIEAIATLKKYSFVRTIPKASALQIHPLVHFWASQRLQRDPTLKSVLTYWLLLLIASALDGIPSRLDYYLKDLDYTGPESWQKIITVGAEISACSRIMREADHCLHQPPIPISSTASWLDPSYLDVYRTKLFHTLKSLSSESPLL
ncbi:hypothetical protein CKM354_000791300 [Cercospora kikuchii]|uniref:PNPLA domain-containing protein n=1 Tax=Cercospora kikuchii TaxID=84275 RepID=A0A9P3CNN5_9PEZI|nr:uncharacterized protein CKM354_000791300 [Cercospora kikuchii]GIZ44722.1 hypothetical protein CKM354_000791300 [Cercospora kikuchii]